MKKEAHIAVAWGSPGSATAEISNVVEELTGKQPKPIRLTDLAGPNETIQVLLNVEDWILIAKAVAIVYGTEIVREVAKSTWSSAKPIIKKAKNSTLSLFERFVRGISQAKHAKAPVVLGIHRNIKGGKRHIGFEIEDTNPENIARIISILAKYSNVIESKLDDWEQFISNKKSVIYEQNSDCSVKLIITDNGGIQLKATVSNNNFKTRESITYDIVE